MDLPDDFDATKMFDAEYMENLQKKIFEAQFEQENKERQEGLSQNQKNLDIALKLD